MQELSTVEITFVAGGVDGRDGGCIPGMKDPTKKDPLDTFENSEDILFKF